MFRGTLLLSTGAAFRALARTPAVSAVSVTSSTRPSSFARSLRMLSTISTDAPVDPFAVKNLTGNKLFMKERLTRAYAEQKISSSTGTKESSSANFKRFAAEWMSLSQEEKDSFKKRAAAGEGANKVFKWPTLYPKEVKISQYFVFSASRQKELLKSMTVPESGKKMGAEWKEMSEAQKAKFPKTTQIKQAPKSKSEIYPKEFTKFTGYQSFCNGMEGLSAAKLDEKWKAMSDVEKADYPVVKYTAEKAEEGANFNHFYRLHSKRFMELNKIIDPELARKALQAFWDKLNKQEKSAYAL